MKFGKVFSSQLVHEWESAYMDYNSLKIILKGISRYKELKKSSPMAETSRRGVKRRLSLYRAFSGLTGHYRSGASPRNAEDEVILISAVRADEEDGEEEGGGESRYRTTFLMHPEHGGESEPLFFEKLDDEFNKVLNFYWKKVREVSTEAEDLNKQMDALIALRIKVENPIIRESILSLAVDADAGRVQMDAIPEVEMSVENSIDEERQDEVDNNEEKKIDHEKAKIGNGRKVHLKGFRPASLDILNCVKINNDAQTPVSTIKAILPNLDSGLSFSKVELKKTEQRITQAFVEFHRKLRLLKRYSFLNQLAFSKIMKKYDKITSRNASKAYMQMVDKSDLGSNDVVNKLIERVERTFVKHFKNGNHRKGMKVLRPIPIREKHRTTFFMGLFIGCSIALAVAIFVVIRARQIYKSEGLDKYMRNIFPLYSMYGFIVLHMIMYAGNIYYWKRYRINYPFIFGFKQGTEMNYRDVLLLASGLAVLTLAGVLSNLNMEMDPVTQSYEALTELVPLALLIVVLLIIFCPFNTLYRSSRYFLIGCVFHCLATPFYKASFTTRDSFWDWVILPDFFLADQATSQVQALRNLEFYVCYYGWGDFKRRLNSCHENTVFKTFNYIVAIVPYWIRFLQSIRRLVEERDNMHALNGLKYMSTIVAVAMRTTLDLNKGMTMRVLAGVASGVATVANTYWDVVIDWGLLRKDSKNYWLRDKLAIPHHSIYYAAIVLNVVLRLAWMQSVLGVTELPFLPSNALIAVIASLEIIRRGIWNFFRLENEHLNNVGKYRAFKSVPLPFNYDNEDKSI